MAATMMSCPVQSRFERRGRAVPFDPSPTCPRRRMLTTRTAFDQRSSWSTHTAALERQFANVRDRGEQDPMGPLGCSISTGSGVVLNELKRHPLSSIAVFDGVMVGRAGPSSTDLSTER